ncbi:MAG TPA: hypothetical protein P5204_01550 [Kiritimatiellia bacterium]|nr:hypothetical protein [Kiritimatiellia bacterium]
MHLRKVLWMAIALGALAARGEDLTTLQNVTYTNVKVQRHDREGLLVRHDGGETKIPFNAILPELREYYKRMASDLTPAKEAAAPEPPAGPNDLEVRGGRIYRNVVVRKVESYAVQLDHDGGSVKVYFTDIPDKDARDRVRTAVPVPVEPPGPDDFVTLDGQIFRRVEVLRTEPDGLTFRHAGGVTKRRFASLPEDVRKRYGYDPEAEKKYLRDQAEAKKRVQEEEATRRALKKFDPQSAPTGVAEPLAVVDVKTRKLPNQEYQVSFTVQNRTDQLLFIRTIPYDAKMKALAGGKKFKIQPQSKGEQLDLVVPLVAPSELRIYCGDFQTNRALRW